MHYQNRNSTDTDTHLANSPIHYLEKITGNLENFGVFFKRLKLLFIFQLAISLIVVVMTISSSDIIPAAILLITLGHIIFWVWFTELCETFVIIQHKKYKNDHRQMVMEREDSEKRREDILKKAEQKSKIRITIQGENASLALDENTISILQPSKTVEGNRDLIENLSLLVSFCELSGSREAARMARQLTEEAVKQYPDKGIIFNFWSKIAAGCPEIAYAKKIIEGLSRSLWKQPCENANNEE